MDNVRPTLRGILTCVMDRRQLVTLEPELQEEVGLYTVSQRLELARKFARWARQLRVSAVILRRQQNQLKACASLKALPRRKLRLN